MSDEIGWSNVISSMGTNSEGVTEKVTLAQCPVCVAVVWSVNIAAHELWHHKLGS